MIKKTISILACFTLLLCVSLLAGCASTTPDNTEEKIPFIINSREFNRCNVELFYDKWYEMESNANKVLNPFAENPEITDEFLNDIHKVQFEYNELIAYTKTLTVEEYQYSINGKPSIQTELETGWVKEPIMEVYYSDNSYNRYGWSYDNGVITIKDGYYVDVEFTENLNTTSAPDDYDNERTYTVKNSSKDSYLLFSGEIGYQLIRIIAD